MKGFEENHMTFTHKSSKLQAVFIDQPMKDPEQAKVYAEFLTEMQDALQKFVESSVYFRDASENNDEQDKE